MPLTNLRQLRDAKLSVTKAFPAANAANQSPTLDIGAGPYHPENIMVEIVIPPQPANSDNTKTITIRLQDSADNVTFADTDVQIQTNIVGVTTTGSLGKTVTFRLPPNVRQYIQFTQTVPTGAGDSTALSVTYSILV